MSIEKFFISRDPVYYEAWPDVVLTGDGTLVCVFCQCTHHKDRSYTRIMQTESSDRGRTWSPKHPVTEGTEDRPYYFNCPRIFRLSGERLGLLVDRIRHHLDEGAPDAADLLLFESADNGRSWSAPRRLPLSGIVPDKLVRSDSGRLFLSAHHSFQGRLAPFLISSDDGGETWTSPRKMAYDPDCELCEASLLPLGGGVIAALLRDNTCRGADCRKLISRDDGETWSSLLDFPLPGGYRPVAGLLNDGRILITYRFCQGGRRAIGANTQNLFAALTTRADLLEEQRSQTSVNILPVDHDRSVHADTGYSGWVQFPDGEIYIVNYIVDDAGDRAQIRGYSLFPDEIVLSQQPPQPEISRNSAQP